MIINELVNLKRFIKQYTRRKRLKKKELFQILKLINKFDAPVIVYKSIIAVFSDNEEVLNIIKENVDKLGIEGLNARILDRKLEITYDLEDLGELVIRIKYYVLLIGKFELKDKRKIIEQGDKKKVKEEIPPYVYT